MYMILDKAPGIAIHDGKATMVALNSGSFGSNQNCPGVLTDYPPTQSADTVAVGWGLCRQWPADWCHGYKVKCPDTRRRHWRHIHNTVAPAGHLNLRRLPAFSMVFMTPPRRRRFNFWLV